MKRLIRSWPGLAASGAALLYAAVGAGLVVSAPPPGLMLIGAALIAMAGLHALWSVATLRSGVLVRPTLGLILFLTPPVLWALALFSPSGTHDGHTGASAASAQPSTIATAPMATAVLLSLALAMACGVRMRRPIVGTTPAASGPRFVVGLILGGLVISALVTPALAGSDAGELAVPHGTHSAH